MNHRLNACLVLAAALTGCDAAQRGTEDTPPAHAPAPGRIADPPPASANLLPQRFGLGRAATRREIALVDIDVDGEGRGLPAGGGTAHEGAVLYAARCAACHGPEGEGTPAGNRLVAHPDPHTFVSGDVYDAFAGRTIGNFWPYAPTLFDYIRRAMPLDRPGSLRDDEVYALVAWLLWKNRIISPDARMDATTLPGVRMPARDRFVTDDRETSNRVR